MVFIRKAVKVKVAQWTGDNIDEIAAICAGRREIIVRYGIEPDESAHRKRLYLNNHGEEAVELTDYIVREDKGLYFIFSICSEKKFKQLYEIDNN